MNCKILFNHASDRYYWIQWIEFKDFVDHKNLACRDSEKIEECYLSGWFYDENGEHKFIPPAFRLENGRARFINGRHRTVLLSNYLDILPMALTEIDSESQHVLDRIVVREIKRDEDFLLPNLPIKELIVGDKS